MVERTPSERLAALDACVPALLHACRRMGASRIFSKSRGLGLTQSTARQSPPGTHGLRGFRGGIRYRWARCPGRSRAGLAAWLQCLPCTSHVLVSPRDAARREVYFLGVIGRRACVPSLRAIRLVLAKLCSVEITVESGLHDPPPYTSHALVSPRDTARREVYFLGVLGSMCMCTKLQGNPSCIGRLVIS